MKKSAVVLALLVISIIVINIIYSVNFVSAGWFSDVWSKITGKAIETNETSEENMTIELVPEQSPEQVIKQVCCKITVKVPESKQEYKRTPETECPPSELVSGTDYEKVSDEYCERKITCESDVQKCSDGSLVSRNPSNNCEFYSCPEKTGPLPEPSQERVPVRTCAAKIKISSNQKVHYLGDYLEITIEILDSEGNLLPNYPLNGLMYENKWRSLGPPTKTNEQGYVKHTGTVDETLLQKAIAIGGKIQFKVSTQGLTECGGIEDILEIEVRKAEKEEVCGIGVCVPEEEKTGKIENISEEKKERILYSCAGCELNNKCYPLGYRKEGEYCSINYEFVIQKEEGGCENNFECKSNVCVSGECIGENLMKRIIKWFKKLFGQEEPEGDKEVKLELCSKLLIEKNIENHKYNQTRYGESKSEQAPLYSEDGKQIGAVKCCATSYDENRALICPYDNREDLYYSLKELSSRGEIYLGEYNEQKVYKLTGKKVIVWINDKHIIAIGTETGNLLPESVVNAYLKKYPNDLAEFLEKIEEEPIETMPPERIAKEPVSQPPYRIIEEFLNEIEKLGTTTLIDFETLPDETLLQNGDKLTGKEWESLGVIFETPSEEYLKVFGANYPFNPIDKLSLSPGFGPFEDGSDTDDDLNIIFTKPVKAVGIYLLDLGETDERESITFFDKEGNIIEKISPWSKSTFGNPAPGTFVRLTHEGISKIEILENTRDSDDIAYDNLYFVK